MMLWALAITICLAHEDDVKCRTWRQEPFVTKYECQTERRRMLDALEGMEAHHVHMKCERGHYS